MITDSEKPPTIGVLGAHSTGKSTFLARLAHDLRRKGIQVSTVSDLGERAHQIGLPILQNHTSASTLWFISRGISLELEAWLHADVVLVDRPIPDAIGYYLAALDYRGEEADPGTLAYLEQFVRGHSGNYDLLFRTTLDPTIPLGDNKARDSDSAFRRLADHYIGQVLEQQGLTCRPLAADGHDEALAQAIELTENLLARRENP